MYLENLKNKISDLGTQIAMQASMMAGMNDLEEMDKAKEKLDTMRRQMDILKDTLNATMGDQMGSLDKAPAPTNEERSMNAMRGSREYARAFAKAMRNGVSPERSAYDESLKVLYDTLTIAGGNPAGSDGGFLVPEDIDNMIREKRRALTPLADLFTVENVNTNSGWRVIDTAPTTGFTALSSEIPSGGIASDDQPSFAKVSYSLTTYGLFIPVSKELAADEDANLFGYLAQWFAKKQILTENALIKAKLNSLTPSTVSSGYTTAISNAINITLDPEIAVNAAIITNQNGFGLLDTLVDANGRPLLQRDITAPTPYTFKGLPVKVMSNSQLPNVTSGADSLMPMYIGDFKEYATLFTRQPLEMNSTDIGGEAFRKNSVEVRGITRLDCRVFDSAAACYLQLK